MTEQQSRTTVNEIDQADLDPEDPDVCACGDHDWGACPKDTCHAQYEEESNR